MRVLTTLTAAAAAVLTLAGPAAAAGQPPVPGPGEHPAAMPMPLPEPAVLPVTPRPVLPEPAPASPPRPDWAMVLPSQDRPGSHLLLLAQPTGRGPLDAAYLVCSPPGGNHPEPRSACKTLQQAGGRFEELKPADGFCTKEYAPVRVYAFGHWKDEPVAYVSKLYGNRCEANLATGHVFDF
ncbi:SSI family serine proteinase inhibitor [Streptomyces sp. NPDC051940]|uniref:SSI family serine proteinase inhibitor n=1 Tax=Streptomyces sp. NPDC051940 TaxID=3155675 RepID=UPI003437A955